jgi:hypothetical protein
VVEPPALPMKPRIITPNDLPHTRSEASEIRQGGCVGALIVVDGCHQRLESTVGMSPGLGLAHEPADASMVVFRMTRRRALGMALTGRVGDPFPVLLKPGPAESLVHLRGKCVPPLSVW